MKIKNRKQKQNIYTEKYGDIPVDFNERLEWMYSKFKINESKADRIIEKRDAMISQLHYIDVFLTLFEVPEGAVRPKFRIIGPKNYAAEAMRNPQFVHVYVPHAAEDNVYMKRMTEQDLFGLQNLIICTPCVVEYCLFCETPKAFNIEDTFLAEVGLIRPTNKPDWDNAGKKYSDMSNHNIWLDDTLVIEGTVKKFYSLLPRVEIRLRYQNMLYNRYQYNSIVNRKDYNDKCMEVDYFKM